MAGGSQFGYMLLWVVLAANLMAMLIQPMSAKLGIATGLSLPEVCRDRFPFGAVICLWLQAEVIAMATDLAEFVGAALGINLVFGLPLFISRRATGHPKPSLSSDFVVLSTTNGGGRIRTSVG